MSKQHNAFYYFMLDFESKQGQKYKSLRQVAEVAGPHWKKLSKAQRKHYEELARKNKGTEKLNSDRRPVEEVENMERENMRRKQQMKDDIMAKLAILKRRNGALPLGYAATAQIVSSDTHQIELPLDDEDNQEAVFEKVIAFLESYTPKGSTDELPILYAAEKHLPVVEGVFDQWCEKFGVDRNRLQIYNLQYMFRVLRNTVAGVDCWASDTMSYHEIEKDVYCYTPNIACEFHEICDVLCYCSRSFAVRYGFTICDNCCKDAKIELIPGCHVPENAITTSNNTFETVKSSKKKKSTKYTSDSSSIRDDSSDVDTLITNRNSGVHNYTSPESPRFPRFDNTASSSRTSTNSAGSSADASNRYDVRATSSQIGSSGFSRRPAALPFGVTEGLESLTITQESRDIHFPALRRARGRGSENPNSIGRGRGNPFQRNTSRF